MDFDARRLADDEDVRAGAELHDRPRACEQKGRADGAGTYLVEKSGRRIDHPLAFRIRGGGDQRSGNGIGLAALKADALKRHPLLPL